LALRAVGDKAPGALAVTQVVIFIAPGRPNEADPRARIGLKSFSRRSKRYSYYMGKTKPVSLAHLRPGRPRPPQRGPETFQQRRQRFQSLTQRGEKNWEEACDAGLLHYVPDQWRQYLKIIVDSAQDLPTWTAEVISGLPGPEDRCDFDRDRRVLITRFTVDLCNQIAVAPAANHYPIYSQIVERLVPTRGDDQRTFSQWREEVDPHFSILPADSAEQRLATEAINVIEALERDDLSAALEAMFAVDDLFAPGAPFADPLSYRWYHSSFLLVLEKWHQPEAADSTANASAV